MIRFTSITQNRFDRFTRRTENGTQRIIVVGGRRETVYSRGVFPCTRDRNKDLSVFFFFSYIHNFRTRPYTVSSTSNVYISCFFPPRIFTAYGTFSFPRGRCRSSGYVFAVYRLERRRRNAFREEKRKEKKKKSSNDASSLLSSRRVSRESVVGECFSVDYTTKH